MKQSYELVRSGDGVEIGLLAVVEVGVWLPYALQHSNAECQSVLGGEEGKPSVHPGLPEVAVHRIRLQDTKHI